MKILNRYTNEVIYERYTYHDTTQPIHQKRIQGFKNYCEKAFGNDFYNSNKLVVIYDIEKDT